MADKKIEDATPDIEVTGVEKLPVSDSGVAKCMTVAQVKDFVLAQIAALQAAGAVDVGADGVYLLKGGVMKPVDAGTLAAAVLDYGFGKVAVAAMNGNEVIGVKDASAQKTITVTQLKAWLQANMTVSADIDIGAKAAAGVLSGSDLLLVAQSGTNKKLTVALFTAYAHAAFKDYVTALTAVDNLSNSDVFYVVNGTTAKKCTVAQLKTIIGAGDVIAPDAQTAGNVPAWDSAAKKLTDGYGVANNISVTPSATKLATESAVSYAVGAKVDKVTGKGLSQNDYTDAEKAKVAALADAAIAVWTAGKSYAVGDYCLQGGFLRRCVHAGATQTFVETDWAYIPPYPTSAANTKFLRGDGTWQVPPTATDFVGATEQAAGQAGLVPAPATTARDKYLKGDGTWGDPAEGCAFAPATQTTGSLPQWTEVGRILSSGIPCRPQTASDSVTDLTDEQALGCVPTVKGVRQEIAARTPSIFASLAGFAKADAKTLTAATENLSNRTVHLFNVATGGSYALALPAAVEGRSREFYVAFSQSGTQGATSTVSLTSATQIHARNGIVTSLTLTKDVAGDSQAFHVYHFFEDASQVWCVNEFAAAEGGGGGSSISLAATSAVVSGTPVQLVNNTSHRLTITAGTDCTLVLPQAVSGKMREFYVSFYMSSSSVSVKDSTVSFTTDGTTEATVLYKGEGVSEMTISILYVSPTYGGNESRIFHFFENASGLVCEEVCAPVDGSTDFGRKNLEAFKPDAENPNFIIYPNTMFVIGIEQDSPQSLTVMNALVEFGEGAEDGYYDGTLAVSVASGASVPTIALPEGSPTVLVLPDNAASLSSLLTAGKTTWLRFEMMYIKDDSSQSPIHTHVVFSKIGVSDAISFPE